MGKSRPFFIHISFSLYLLVSLSGSQTVPNDIYIHMEHKCFRILFLSLPTFSWNLLARLVEPGTSTRCRFFTEPRWMTTWDGEWSRFFLRFFFLKCKFFFQEPPPNIVRKKKKKKFTVFFLFLFLT